MYEQRLMDVELHILLLHFEQFLQVIYYLNLFLVELQCDIRKYIYHFNSSIDEFFISSFSYLTGRPE